MSTAGIAIGALIAWAASGVLRALLYEVSATDVAVFGASALGLAAVTLAGYLVPRPAPPGSSQSSRSGPSETEPPQRQREPRETENDGQREVGHGGS